MHNTWIHEASSSIKNPDPSLQDPQGNIIAACRVGCVQSMQFLKYYPPIIEQWKKPGCLGYILITVYHPGMWGL